MERPTSVTVFGIIHLVLGALGLCGTVIGAVMLLHPQFGGNLQADNPILKLIEDNAVYRLFIIVTTGLGAVAAIVLIAAGIGLLMSMPWARIASIVYAWYAIVMAGVTLVVNLAIVLPAIAPSAAPGAGPQAAVAAGQFFGTAVGVCCGGVFGLTYPIFILIFMHRAAVVQHFRLQGQGIVIDDDFTPASW